MSPALSLTLTTLLLAQAPPAAPAPSPEDAARQERLQSMRERAAEFTLLREGATEPLPLKAEPIVRYTNPEREGGTWDGATFLWLEGARPVAAISFGIRAPKNAVFAELTSLVQTPLVCRKGEALAWSPQTGGLAPRPFEDAPPPAATPTSRLTQMRSLARRFAAECTYKEDVSQMRLLPQPLYRYADEKSGLVDGGLFALVVSNDPEMFLILELVRTGDADKPQWHYALARMCSLKQTVRLDDKEIWTIPGFYTLPPADRKTGPYVEAYQGIFTSALPAQP